MELICQLEPYILNEKNMSIYLKYKFKDHFINDKKNNNIEQQTNFNTKNKLFIPPEEDSLFWCYYIIKNGDIKYEMLNNKNNLIAKQLKIDYIKSIRDNKQIVKSYKFDTISNIESNLANDMNINIKTIMTLCVIEKINLIFINKKTYFELLMNDSNNIYVIDEIQVNTKYNKKYGFELASNETLNEIKNLLYKLDSLDKPIKSISLYKVPDLINIANKLAIEVINKQTGKNKTKNELYELIVKYF
jgi:hypothetical protein